jgi:pyridoxamine 5'-phosphate oxidase
VSVINPTIAALRREYSRHELTEDSVSGDPIDQFSTWFNEAMNADVLEPNAFTLATVGSDNRPSVRTILLKSLGSDGFIFFTNYQSRKGEDLTKNPYAAMCFLWLEVERQVRVEGKVEKLTAETSDEYFATRPKGSQIGAWVSPQSQPITKEELEKRLGEISAKYADNIPRPPHWGGYLLKPDMIEFWQGRPSRLHDRIIYTREDKSANWKIQRLAP